MTKPITILAISSSVAAGHVGLAAIVPALNLLGHEVAALPTVLLSNHPGFPHVAGEHISPGLLHQMFNALEAGGMLDHVETILSGYLPTPEHVAFVETVVARILQRAPSATYICDPILGDDPKGLYIAEAAAMAIRDRLVPLADILLPNRFELAWLAGRTVSSPAGAVAAARSLPARQTIAKSIPLSESEICTIAIGPRSARGNAVRRHDGVPNGTGDMFSALIAAGWTFDQATGALAAVIEASIGQPHLAIVATADRWRQAAALSEAPDPVELTSSDPVAMSASLEEPRILGADGCPGGWIAVSHPPNEPHRATWAVFETFSKLLAQPNLAAIAVDIPIGLPARATPGGRAADREARAVLGARQSSVFAVPARAAIACTDYRTACETALATSDPPRKVSKQTFNLFPKIREVDALMTPAHQARIVECHPELAFWAMNGRRPLHEPKKVKSMPYAPGLALRRDLLAGQGFDRRFLEGPDCPRHIAAADDFLDACATAWTANRLAAGHVERVPAAPPLDPYGLRMEIVF